MPSYQWWIHKNWVLKLRVSVWNQKEMVPQNRKSRQIHAWVLPHHTRRWNQRVVKPKVPKLNVEPEIWTSAKKPASDILLYNYLRWFLKSSCYLVGKHTGKVALNLTTTNTKSQIIWKITFFFHGTIRNLRSLGDKNLRKHRYLRGEIRQEKVGLTWVWCYQILHELVKSLLKTSTIT